MAAASFSSSLTRTHTHPWFDAHLDLAYLAVCARDMTRELDPSAGPHAPASVTLPALQQGRVRLCLGTIFTEPVATVGDVKSPEMYPAGDPARAFAAGRAQLEAYLTWRDRGLISLNRLDDVKADPGVGQIQGGMGVASVVPYSMAKRLTMAGAAASSTASKPLHLGILIENADPIRSPNDLAWWHERGVVAVGMAWAKSSRYAGGNSTSDGVSPLGHELVREMDRLNVVHDASHLSDRAFDELMGLTDRRVIASHSNCRALLGDPKNQRHLTDAQIKAIIGRDGVIGLNLFSRFIESGLSDTGRASIDAAAAHVEHICGIARNTAHVGLGSDMDGGFAADRLPRGVNTPAQLDRLLDALSAKGWSDESLAGFACENWGRVFA